MAFGQEGGRRFKALADLDDKLFSKLVTALRDSIDVFAVRSAVADYAEKNAPKNAEEFALALEAVIPLVLDSDFAVHTPEEVAKGVLSGLARSVKDKAGMSVAEQRVLKSRIKMLVADAEVKLRTRAWNLVAERPCLLEESRILTDLRPVFSEKNPASLDAFSVIHTLVLNCNENSTSKTVHIALDTADLAELKAAIVRAEHKEKVLSALASKAGVLRIQIK